MLSLSDVAARLNISYALARRLVLAGDIEGCRIGSKSIRVTQEALDAYVEGRRIRQPTHVASTPRLVHIKHLRHFTM